VTVTAFWPRSRRRLAARTIALSMRVHALEDALARQAADRGGCGWQADPDAGHRLLHRSRRRLAAQQREIDQLHATIARLRPRLLKGD